MSKHVHKFSFEIGPLQYNDEIPFELWSKVPQAYRFMVKKNLRDSLEAKLKEHLGWCWSCRTGWWNPFNKRQGFPCPVFSLSFTIIRKLWRNKLTASVKVLMKSQALKVVS